ncbi:hemerythrin domain-containing protein [Streptomyces albus]
MAHRPDVTELLTDQHAETERLLAAYEAAREPERRAALADAVVTALQRRARAEEDLLAPVARRVLPEGERLAGAVAGRQAAAVRAARRLRGTGDGGPPADGAAALHARLTESAGAQNALLAGLRKRLGGRERRRLGEQIARRLAGAEPVGGGAEDRRV